MNKNIIVWALCALTAGSVSAQQTIKIRKINGRVLESSGENTPIPYATIRLMSADSLWLDGTVSDAEGNFTLHKEGVGDDLIVASCIGYEMTSLAVSREMSGDTLIIQMQPAVGVLDEVTVTGTRMIRKGDRKLLIPEEEQVRTSTDGVDLLRKMQLPRIVVNQLSGEISQTGGGKIVLCLNGVQVSSAELAAVRPEDIVRIEYHDAPGARYAGAGAVIDYIVRRTSSGGNVAADSFDALGKGKWASIDHLSAQYSRGKSAWSFVAGYMGQRRDNWVRDYEETWHYPDRDVNRREEGTPVSIGGHGLQGFLNYSLGEKDHYIFNTRLGLTYDYIPAKEEGDRRTQLFTSDHTTPLDIYEHTTAHSLSPTIDFYLQRSLGNGQQLIFDVLGTYIHTDSRRIYRESCLDDLLSMSYSDVCGRKYSLIMEGVYERDFGHGRLSGGVRHQQAFADNRYEGTLVSTVSMRQAESAAFVECRYSRGFWGATGSLTASRIRYSQDGCHTENLSLQPSARLTFQPADRLSFCYDMSLRTQSPQLSSLSNVTQEIQTGMVRRGNPELKPFRLLNQQLKAEYDSRFLHIDFAMGYRHEYHPIMESVFYEDGLFVRTYENQRSFKRLSAETTFLLRLWPEHFRFSVTPLIYRYISRGNTYRHSYTIKRLKLDADFTWGNWLLSYNTMMGPANVMYGEESTEEKNMNVLLVGYKQERWAVQVGLFNAFMQEYWMETRSSNALTPFTSRAHCNRNTYLALKCSFNLKYGKLVQRREKQIHNEDKEAGIMQGTK